jgi:MerR family transcriptional regulator, thiopeptide resistance regulator
MTSWSVRAFAQLSGVTVRALHHYERRGLLAPRRSRAGYRRYTLVDLARLERVLALKSLGFALGEIAAFMDVAGQASAGASRPAASTAHVRADDVRANARAQRERLAALRERIDRAIDTLDAIDRDARPAAAVDRFVRDAAWDRWEAKRAALASPAPRAPDRASPSRFALFHEIREALDRDPSGASARPLAARWRALIDAEAEGNAEVVAAMRAIARTRAQWPDGARRYVASLYDAEVDTWDRVMTFVAQSAEIDDH